MGNAIFTRINPDATSNNTIPFPAEQARSGSEPELIVGEAESADDVLAAFASVSRRINDLARELRCLGYFDDENDDRPRAA